MFEAQTAKTFLTGQGRCGHTLGHEQEPDHHFCSLLLCARHIGGRVPINSCKIEVRTKSRRVGGFRVLALLRGEGEHYETHNGRYNALLPPQI
jgi:hypothetical protein